ncbi:TlpA family protein disulfide reductase [Mucilaginibacter myungsuensis]|uniref:Redoxin family protein n=1 Tax=Mucilaginibacter myungsuensis TaxID=649104 RepID=A0A929KZP5_9SPHI|nr:redoxin family protein [Mucilaginibacter myungsuensis]MBE9664676.1 redoxin family protein [Mucilaginibacter myungsuensis]MDN3601119.1 redoxin family protein [Mucilaginibacter myungsuensis]
MLSRRAIFVLFFLFTASVGRGQRLEISIDSLDATLKHDMHGDSIRKYYSNSLFNYNSSLFTYKSLLMEAFYSNRLAVDHQQAIKKIPQLKNYRGPGPRTSIQPLDGYAGKYGIPIFDSSGVIVTVNGINPSNADQYQFRVIKDKTTEVLPWTQPKLFCIAYMMTRIADRKKEDSLMAYLGKFKAPYGSALTIQVREKAFPDNIKSEISAVWISDSLFAASSKIVKADLGTPMVKLPFGAELYQLDASADADKFVTNLKAKFQKKAIIVDIWATWCAPCIADLPFSKDLREMTKNLDIEYVYLCTNSASSLDTWKNKVAAMQIPGTHVFVDDSVLAKIRAAFNTSGGFPTYVAIDINGQIKPKAVGHMQFETPESIKKAAGL